MSYYDSIKGYYDCIVIHYAEIGIKGKNRKYFEELLIKNIKSKLNDFISIAKRESGQITLYLKESLTGETFSAIREQLSLTPGIAYFSFAKRCPLNIDKIKHTINEILNLINKNLQDNSKKDLQNKTFKIDARRANKNFSYNSMELNKLLGEFVIEKFKSKVSLKEPDIKIKVEVSNNVYISIEDIKAIGGLPVNPKQKVVALLSGGFDSPVASFLMMKRGVNVILVHFKNQNQVSASVENKIIELGKRLSEFQPETKLYIVPFEKIQKEIIIKVHSTQRMLIYRKFMLRIASKIAELNKAKFLVVGDSLSQVASQTLDNLKATYYKSPLPVLTPLIGLDKTEIIETAKQIGTYEISKLPYGDCCSYFLPKHPELKAHPYKLEQAMALFDIENLVNNAVENSKIIEF